MKSYDYTEAQETLFGLFQVQDKALLAKELAKIVVKHSDVANGWSIKDLEMKITKDNGKFIIKIGNE